MPRPNRIIRHKPTIAIPSLHRTAYIISAYGRTYSTRENLERDWLAGKDFKILNGPYLSIRDLEALRPLYRSLALYPLTSIEMSPFSHLITLEK